jgi:DNA (cytosine-5)-methyltransferase 1
LAELQAVSLFSGAGISDFGFHQEGIRAIAQCEIYPPANAIRRRHFPDADHHRDVKEFDGKRYQGADALIAGFPCNDFSIAGPKAGLEGHYGALFFDLARIIGEVQPNLLFLENVPNLLSQRLDFHTILKTLVELGYCVGWRVLDLRYFRVPQRRRRVLFVGSRLAGPYGPGPVLSLFEPDCLQRGAQKGRRKEEADQPSLGGLFEGSGVEGPIGTLNASGAGTTRPAVNANELDFCIPHLSKCLTARPQDGHDDSRETYIPHFASTLTAHHGRNDNDNTYLPSVVSFGWNKSASQTLREGEQCDALMASKDSNPAIARLPLIDWDRDRDPLEQMIEAGIDARSLEVRRLLPVECERLMGLPDDYTLLGDDDSVISNSARYRVLGGGWSVPQARWAARRALEACR